jgi:hypothetical protein
LQPTGGNSSYSIMSRMTLDPPKELNPERQSNI